MKTDIIGSLFFGCMIFIIALMVGSMKVESGSPVEITPTVQPWIEDLCEQVVLRNPGGLDFEIGEVCYHPQIGFTKSRNISRLKADDYDKIVEPVKGFLKEKAEAMGL